MIDGEFERKGREMSDKLNQIQPIPEVDMEYTLGDVPALTAEQIYNRYDVSREVAQLRAELDAANERIKKQLREIVELSKERERFALVIDSSKFPDTAAELIGQLRLDIVAAKERAEQAEKERDAAQQSRARLVKLLCAIDETLPTDGAPHYHGLMGRLNLLNSRLEYAEQGLLDYAILRVSLTERISKAEADARELAGYADYARRVPSGVFYTRDENELITKYLQP